ncbi:PREDICTED: FHA [Prunus dulcis]|uniref:PREDICTED: FHA n=1 Tax=Prunus dulcis TaxID=3755 RepID=A0A5E4G3L5_PRUDU|nr:PREDICTED: FHA [Prunus dulcis]
MEITAQHHLSISHTKLPRPSSSSSFRASAASLLASTTSLPFQCSNNILQGQGVLRIKGKQLRSTFGPIYASSSKAQSPPPPQKWLLEPVGDGDTRHIGFKVPMPSAFEISADEVTVGRLPEEADMVIPVATEGKLLVTDLDSTNGTFIDDKRLSAGVVATVPPGSCLTFGDEHLAVFRVSKLENVEAASNPDPSEDKIEADIPNENAKTS